jgi:hypothetical protein
MCNNGGDRVLARFCARKVCVLVLGVDEIVDTARASPLVARPVSDKGQVRSMYVLVNYNDAIHDGVLFARTSHLFRSFLVL